MRGAIPRELEGGVRCAVQRGELDARLDGEVDLQKKELGGKGMARRELSGEGNVKELNTKFCTCELDSGSKVFFELASPVSEINSSSSSKYKGDVKITTIILNIKLSNKKKEVVVYELAAEPVRSRKYKETICRVKEVEDNRGSVTDVPGQVTAGQEVTRTIGSGGRLP